MNGRFQPGRAAIRVVDLERATASRNLRASTRLKPSTCLSKSSLNEKAPPNARVAAANTLLDRAYGKAPTFSTSDTQRSNGPST